MWLQPEAVEDNIVVSEIGEQWSPHTEPDNTAETEAYKIWMFVSETPPFKFNIDITKGIVIGINIPIVPKLVPVEN